MKYIKMAVISFVVFFSMFTLIGLLFPSSIKSANAVVINKKKRIVLKELQITSAWINWYPFFQTNVGAYIDNAGKDTTIFFNYKKEILVYNKKADSDTVSFFTEYENGRIIEHTIVLLYISGDSNQVQLMWNETEKLKWYPWERFRGLVLEKAKTEYIDIVLSRFKQYIDTVSTN